MTNSLWPKRQLINNEKLCPYDGVAYKDVPGYIPGYGCPICKAISSFHLPVPDGIPEAYGGKEPDAKGS